MPRPYSTCGALLALAALALPAAPASAQIVAQIQSFEGRTSVDLTDLATQNAFPINFGECTGSAQIEWRFTNVDTNRANLSFFSGTGCDQASVRTDNTNTSCTDLEVSFATENLSQVDITFGIDQLINCDATSGVDTIWVLALNQPADEVTGNQVASFQIAYDFEGPAAPSGLNASNGESGSSLTWTSAGTNVQSYEVYRVAGGCEDSMPVLDQASFSPLDSPDGNISSYTVPLPAEDQVGTEYALYVRAFDQSMNPSEFSEVVCIRKVNVDSFLEVLCREGETSADACSSGGGCAVGSTRRSSTPLTLLFLLGACALATRRLR